MSRQAIDQLDLGRGRHDRLFVLQAVARADFDDADAAAGISRSLRLVVLCVDDRLLELVDRLLAAHELRLRLVLEDGLRAHDFKHARAVAAHEHVQVVAGLAHAAVDLAVDDEFGDAFAVDLVDLEAIAADLVAGEEERFLGNRIDAVGRLELDQALERGVGNDDVVLAVGMDDSSSARGCA